MRNTLSYCMHTIQVNDQNSPIVRVGVGFERLLGALRAPSAAQHGGVVKVALGAAEEGVDLLLALLGRTPPVGRLPARPLPAPPEAVPALPRAQHPQYTGT